MSANDELLCLLWQLETGGLAKSHELNGRTRWTVRTDHDDVSTVWATWANREPQNFIFDPIRRTITFETSPIHMLPDRSDMHSAKVLDHLTLVWEEGLLCPIGHQRKGFPCCPRH